MRSSRRPSSSSSVSPVVAASRRSSASACALSCSRSARSASTLRSARWREPRARSASAPSTPRAIASSTSRAISWTLTSARSGRAPSSLLDDRFAQGDRDGLRAVVGLELREDVPHVALDRLLADEELLGDVRVGHPIGQQLQDLALAARDQALTRELEEGRRQGGVDEVFTACDAVDCAHDRVVSGFLEHVAPCAGLAAALQEVALGMRREQHHGGAGDAIADAAGGGDAVDVAHAQTLANDLMVVGDQAGNGLVCAGHVAYPPRRASALLSPISLSAAVRKS